MRKIRHSLLALIWLLRYGGARAKIALFGGLLLWSGCASVTYRAERTVEILYRAGLVRVVADGQERCRVEGGALATPKAEP